MAGDAVLVDERCLGVGPALHCVEFFDAGRYPAERLGHIGSTGSVARPVGVYVGERIEVAVEDRSEGGRQFLNRRTFAGAKRFDQRTGVTGPRRVGGLRGRLVFGGFG